jgi:hypothetical protein
MTFENDSCKYQRCVGEYHEGHHGSADIGATISPHLVTHFPLFYQLHCWADHFEPHKGRSVDEEEEIETTSISD